MSRQPQSARMKIRRLATGRLISVTGGAAAYTALVEHAHRANRPDVFWSRRRHLPLFQATVYEASG